MLHSNNKHVSIQSFEDLANQDVIDYGTVEAGSTMMFFKAHSVAPELEFLVIAAVSYNWVEDNMCSFLPENTVLST